MIDSMFQAGTDQVLDDQNKRPIVRQPDAPGFSFTQLVKAPFQGIGSAGAKAIAFGAELTGAFGDVAGSYPEMFGPVQLTDEQRKQAEQSRRKLLTQGPSFSNEAGDIFRARSRDIMPDPNTTHASAQMVAGLSEFMSSAVGYTLTTGPLAPLSLGLDVGLSEADRLKQMGVDEPTRTKAGAVAGTIAGGSIVLPITGATALVRGAKGVAIGEGTMVGQSVAEKAILQHAGYDKIADTFDPLDPVMLAMGLVPGAFAAKFGKPAVKVKELPPGSRTLTEMGLGERQALKYDDTRLDAYAVQAAQREGIPPEVLLAVKNAGERSGSNATSPKGAQGVMQFMPSTFKEFGRGEITDPVNSIDAAAAYLKKLYGAYGDWDAALAHYNGGGTQAALVRGGAKPSFPETAAYLDRVKSYIGKALDDHVAAAVKAEPDLIRAARVLQTADALDASRLTPDSDLAGRDAHLSAVEMAHDQMAAGEPVRVADMVSTQDPVLFRGVNSPWKENARQDVEFWTPSESHAASYSGPNGQVVSTSFWPKSPRVVEESAYTSNVLHAAQSDGATDGLIVMRDGKPIIVATFDRPAVATGLAKLSEFAQHVKAASEQLAPTKEAAPPVETPASSRAASTVEAARTARVQHQASGKTLADFFAEKPQPPEVQNLLIGMDKAKDDAARARLLNDFESRAQREPTAPLMDVAADAVEGSASKEQPQAAIDRAAAEVSMLNPDMLVRLDGMDKAMRLGDLMESVRADAARDATDAHLVEAAVACALRN
jgi:Transglycosylase SLT domain